MGEFKKTVVIPDLHVPYHDVESLQALNQFIRDFKPDTIIQQGDMYDFYDISRFDKNPERVGYLQKELDIGFKIWWEWRRLCPEARLVFKKGNHEGRMEKYLMRNPELFSLRSLKLPTIFGLDKLNVEYVPSEQNFFINDNLMVLHGDKDDGCKYSANSAYSAKLTLDKIGKSLIMGHTHRLGLHYKTVLDKTMMGLENGCLCLLTPEYVKNPDWQQGFSVVYNSAHRFYVQPIPVVNKRFIYGDKIYGPKTYY